MTFFDSHTQTGSTESDNVTAKKSFLKNPDLMAMTFSHLQVRNDKQSRQCLLNVALTCKDFLEEALDALWEELNSLVPLLKLLPALQVESDTYVLTGDVSQADWDRLQYYSRKVKFFIALNPDVTVTQPEVQVHPSTYLRIAQYQSPSPALFPSLRHLIYYLDDTTISHIFLFLSPLLDSIRLFNIGGFENTIVAPYLATLSSHTLSQIALTDGQMSADIFKKSTVHFKQLRSLELLNAVFMSDFGILEDIGTLPSLEKFILRATDLASHAAHAPENSNSLSGGLKYFEALKSLSVAGSFFLIQHLLGFIDSPCLKSIEVCPFVDGDPNEDDHALEDILTPSMAIISSKWSRSLKNLTLLASALDNDITLSNSKILTLLTNLREIKSFCLWGWTMDNIDDAVRRLAMSWPKLIFLALLSNQTFLSLSTLRIIAENCPDLNHLHSPLDTSIIPPFDNISSKSVRHNLEILSVMMFRDPGDRPSDTEETMLERQIQVARHLDLIFPNLKIINMPDGNWSGIRDLVRLCQDVRRGQ